MLRFCHSVDNIFFSQDDIIFWQVDTVKDYVYLLENYFDMSDITLTIISQFMVLIGFNLLVFNHGDNFLTGRHKDFVIQCFRSYVWQEGIKIIFHFHIIIWQTMAEIHMPFISQHLYLSEAKESTLLGGIIFMYLLM